MGSSSITEKPHAVCVPFPAQGHINPMLRLAKLLHFKGFHITFVNTDYNQKRLLKSKGPDYFNALPSFRFESVPDGLPESNIDVTQDIPSLCDSTTKTCLTLFKNLLSKLNHEASASKNSHVPPVTCIVSDGCMSFTLDAAKELGIPEVLFWTTSACGFACYVQYRRLVQMGITPLKDSSYVTNGYLENVIEWIPGIKDIRLRDIPSFIRTTEPDDIMLNFLQNECNRARMASAIVLNTFDALEHDVLDSFPSINLPPVYSIGPLHLLTNQVTDKDLKSIGSNLWKEEPECLEWLDTKAQNSVVYVNFGSITVMKNDQLLEFAWGLANSKKEFLWVIRPDLVAGNAAVLPPELMAETKNRGLLVNWCPQVQVLSHPAIGGFLTHSGWNSTLESVCAGIPVICWPFFAEQQTNCRFSCTDWGIGMEIKDDVMRDDVEILVRELMEGEKGKQMKRKAMEWKKLAEEAVSASHGSSYVNLDSLVHQVLLSGSLKSA